MSSFNEIERILSENLNLNKPRVNCIRLLILALIQARTANLKLLSLHFLNASKASSSYRRIQRFLKELVIDYKEVARLNYRLFNLDKVTITLDRTNWKWGKKNINIFMLGATHRGIAIPLFWQLLDKRGNSNFSERKSLVSQFLATFGKDKIVHLLADREFVGNDWFKWLDDNDIKFCIRIKRNFKVPNHYGQLVQVHELFRHLSPNETFRNARIITLGNCRVRLFARKTKDNDYLIIATNDLALADAVTIYAKRWEIETLFSCFKGRGFRLEETHLTDTEKMSKLLVVVSLAFCWAYRVGEWQNQKKPIKLKNHRRKTNSLFRVGLDQLGIALKQFILTKKTTLFHFFVTLFVSNSLRLL